MASNKELAVKLYGQFLLAAATVISNPKASGPVQLPTLEEQVAEVGKLAKLLAKIPDE